MIKAITTEYSWYSGPNINSIDIVLRGISIVYITDYCGCSLLGYTSTAKMIPGARPVNDISIEFEIQPKLPAL